MSAAKMIFAAVLLLSALARAEEESYSPVADVKVHAGQPDAVLLLNPFTFDGNVNFESGRVAHWIVLFCVDWYEPCSKLRSHYEDLARTYQARLNSGDAVSGSLSSSVVRFAEVDCTVNKVLCNTQGVEMYPTVNHYDKDHEPSRSWINTKDLAKAVRRLDKWLDEHIVQLPKQLLAKESEKGLSDAERLRCFVGLLAISCFALSIARDAGLICPKRMSCDEVKPSVAQTTSEPVVAEGLTRRHPLLPEEWASEREEMEL